MVSAAAPSTLHRSDFPPVRALLATNDPDSGAEAARILDILKSVGHLSLTFVAYADIEEEFGHKLAVTLLEIEILTKDPNPNVDAYYNGQ